VSATAVGFFLSRLCAGPLFVQDSRSLSDQPTFFRKVYQPGPGCWPQGAARYHAWPGRYGVLDFSLPFSKAPEGRYPRLPWGRVPFLRVRVDFLPWAQPSLGPSVLGLVRGPSLYRGETEPAFLISGTQFRRRQFWPRLQKSLFSHEGVFFGQVRLSRLVCGKCSNANSQTAEGFPLLARTKPDGRPQAQ